MNSINNNMFKASRIASSALKAHENWIEIISNNIANVNTVDSGKKSQNGNFIPYTRRAPVFAKVLSEKFRDSKIRGDIANGVNVKNIHDFKNLIKKVYDPNHPAARKSGSIDAGYVYYPEINLAQELTDIKIAQKGYEANLVSINILGDMFNQALNIGKNN